MKKIFTTLTVLSSLAFANGYVTYEIDGKKYEGYYSSPSKNAPLVYMVHDWDGITDYEIKRVEMLNKLGYAGVMALATPWQGEADCEFRQSSVPNPTRAGRHRPSFGFDQR